MSEMKIHTNASEGPAVAVDGTTVTIDGINIPNIGSVELVGKPDKCWHLVITMCVDPAKLFVADAPTSKRWTRGEAEAFMADLKAGQ